MNVIGDVAGDYESASVIHGDHADFGNVADDENFVSASVIGDDTVDCVIANVIDDGVALGLQSAVEVNHLPSSSLMTILLDGWLRVRQL